MQTGLAISTSLEWQWKNSSSNSGESPTFRILMLQRSQWFLRTVAAQAAASSGQTESLLESIWEADAMAVQHEQAGASQGPADRLEFGFAQFWVMIWIMPLQRQSRLLCLLLRA